METFIMYKAGKNPNSHLPRRKFDVDDNFFETPNLVNSYYAGFIAADGCIKKYTGKFVETHTLTFGLSAKDRDFLDRFAKEISFGGHTREYENNGRKYVRLEIKSNKICDDLRRNFNITERKTFTLIPPNLTDKNLIDAFICGYIDGDGSVFFSKNKDKQKKVGISIVGTHNILSWILNRFCEIYDREAKNKIYESRGGFGSRDKTKKVFTLSITDKWARSIIIKMSELGVPKMERKWTNEIIDFCKTYKKNLPLCRRKGVNSFNLKGEFIKHYETLKDTSRDTGVSVGRISSLCKMNDSCHMANGYMFSRDSAPKAPYEQRNPFAQKRLNDITQ